MAVSVANLTSGATAIGSHTSATTASVTPSANKLLLLSVSSRTNITADPNIPTITGNGLTWVQVATLLWDATSGSRKRTTIYRALGASPSSGTIVIDLGGQVQTNIIWILDEFSGMDATGSDGANAIVQVVSQLGGTTSRSLTMAAFASATNATYGSHVNANGPATATAGTGFTLVKNQTSSDTAGATQFQAVEDTSITLTWNVSAGEYGDIGIEIKEASVGNQTLLPDLFTNTNTFFSPTISQAGGSQNLTPDLYTNNQTFYAPTITQQTVVNHQLSGAVTTTTARVIARLSAEASAQIEYANNSGFTGSTLSSVQNVLSSNDLVAMFNLNGLTANTQYYYRIINDSIASSFVGKFKTFAVGVQSFTFAFSADADIVDSQNVYDRIVARNPSFFFALGDTPYIDVQAASVTGYQNGFKNWFGDTTVKNMLSAFQYEYIWDDHDYGTNNSNASNPGRTFVQSVYRQHIPHYPLEVSDSIYHAFTIGRVRFLVTDLRSERSGTTFLGTSQMTWFKAELTAAKADPDIVLVVWASSVPYISASDSDTWFGASAQRTEIADHIASIGLQNNICIIAGDAHMVAADDGTNSDYSTGLVGGFPVFQSAPLNKSNSTKGGPYSEGTYAASNGQYSVMSVTDNGADISVNVKGFNGSDSQLYTFDFVASPTEQTLSPALIENNNVFYAPTITVGAVTLNLELFVNVNTLFNPSIIVGAVNLAPLLFANENIFYSPTIQLEGGPQFIEPNLFENVNNFFNHTLASSYSLTQIYLQI